MSAQDKLKDQLQLGFEIEMDKSAKALPLFFKPWTSLKAFRVQPSKPLPYMSDALAALSYYNVMYSLYPDFKSTQVSRDQAKEFWNELDPGPALFQSCQDRLLALCKTSVQINTETQARFEKIVCDTFKAAFTPEGVDFKVLSDGIHALQYFEEEMKHPLIYNFKFSFSEKTRFIIQNVESFLFNLRSLVAADINAHVRDTSHEVCKVDSVSDYLPKPDYVVSDALLYFQFKKLTNPFVLGQKSDVRIEKLLVDPLHKAFFQYTQNACYLVNGLPTNFLERLGHGELEEALYLIQMDWLFGTDSGCLFKIREELFGLENGYEKVFWHDLRSKGYLKPAHLQISFELNKNEVFKWSKSA